MSLELNSTYNIKNPKILKKCKKIFHLKKIKKLE